MPLEPPLLDDRTFEQIKRDLQLRIPRYTPEWTDWNESDPGTTLVELFAWLADTLIYRLNQVPARNYVKFLQLLGLELEPAQPSLVHLTFTPNPTTTAAQILVPRRTPVAADSPDGEPVVFETEDALALTRLPLAQIVVFDGSPFVATGRFAPFGENPSVGNALYLGFGPADPAVTGQIFPAELRLRAYLPAVEAPPVRVTADTLLAPSPVSVEWEYLASTSTGERWIRLNIYKDETAGFTREGYILVQAPPADVAAFPTIAGIEEPHYWVRARLTGGVYRSGRSPHVDLLVANTVAARSLSTVVDELLGESTGRPDQTFTVQDTPVDVSTLDLTITNAIGQAEPWTRVDDFFASGRDDLHFTLNPTTGVLQLGDGVSGLIPPAGAEIVVSYRFGGGLSANVAAGAVSQLQTNIAGVDSVSNARRADGGQDEQALDDLARRAPSVLRSQHRAVVAEDFALLATQVGGVARVTAVPQQHPSYPGVEVPGAINVVIVPESDDRPPQPTAALLEAVARHLEPARLITTELFVSGPEYHKVTVKARVEVRPDASPDQVHRDIDVALDAFLSPVPPAIEPEGRTEEAQRRTRPTPLDFGVDFYPSTLFRIILDVDDVVAVPKLEVYVDNTLARDVATAIPVPPNGLLYGDAHHELNVLPSVERRSDR
jgi:predicted phage baseplate assembly protein